MKRHRISLLTLCALLVACSGSETSYPDLSGLPPGCVQAHRVYADYLTKLENTGKFSPDQIACERKYHVMMLDALHNRKSSPNSGYVDEETTDKLCGGVEQTARDSMKKAEKIPNLSQEEFDADWKNAVCQPARRRLVGMPEAP
ncbi:MAG: hypothetical protein LBO79_00130 [Zoogloeaceae bacterium]|jgi:hypothetical protein|nr:hypothetical protein [Zoogloeaceae bacterium]